MKALKYILFIPVMFLVIGLLFWIIPASLFGIMSLSNFWVVFLLLFFGGLIIAAFYILPGGVAWLASRFSPNKKFSFYSISALSILLGLWSIIVYWASPEVSGSGGLGTFISMLLTCLTAGMTSSLIVGAGAEVFEEKGASLGMLLSAGTIIFYLGIFFAFCLLSAKIAYIDPGRKYSWYSGIWHGLFVIPKWIVSWFSDDIFCKAPNSTVAYSIWWWLTLFFTISGIFGGGRGRSSY